MVERLGITGTLIALDPGDATGVAVFEDGTLVHSLTVGGGVLGVIGWAKLLTVVPDAIVCEKFIVEPGFVGDNESLKIEGALLALFDAPITFQRRDMKASLFNQEHGGQRGETERFNWLRGEGFSGTSHELDAVTHALLFLKRRKHPKVTELFLEKRSD